MDPADIRQWAENQRRAADRELAERRDNPIPAERSMAWALALLRLDEARNGSPFERSDSVTLREDEGLRDAWVRLRARWK